MEKKKLLFTAYSLGIGGIETALVNLLKRLDYKKYDVTLILEKKEGIFLNQIPKEVEVLEYKISDNKLVILRKIINRIKLIKWTSKLKDKYDFSCNFATYSIPGAHLALAASNNSTLWMHGNYYVLYDYNENEMRKFLDTVFIKKFKRIVFVSEENMRDVTDHYTEVKDKAMVCNNFINGDEILEKEKEIVEDYKKDNKVPLFINVGRHDEHQKKLTRIIDATKKLVSEGYDFKIIFIGDGPDSYNYNALVKKYNLDDKIEFLGRKANPFPYYKMADAVLLSSEYEGYPVVFLEAMLLNKPILSTKVSDWENLDKKNGLFCDRDAKSVYNNMKKYLDEGFKIKAKFDYKKYNEEIYNKIMKMIEDK